MYRMWLQYINNALIAEMQAIHKFCKRKYLQAFDILRLIKDFLEIEYANVRCNYISISRSHK